MNNVIAFPHAPDRLVKIENGHTTTTSLIVAEAFGKQHRNVLRDIRNIECSEEFRRLNFEQSAYINEQGKAQPITHITRDGAMMLIMGFTGTKAAGMREAFIAEFGRMEAALKALSDKRAIKAEAEARRALRELAAARRQIITYARREIRELKARQGLPLRAPAVDPRQQPLDFDLSGMTDLATLDLDLSHGLEG